MKDRRSRTPSRSPIPALTRGLASLAAGLKGTPSNSTFTPGTKSGSFDCTFTDGPTSTVSVTVNDEDGGSGSDSKVVSIANLPPTLTITAPPYGQIYPISAATVTFRGSFTDPGTGDTHTCTASWDDGTNSAGVVAEANGSGTCTATHTYTAPGVYTVSMTVTDDEGASDTEQWLVVVYDPNGGFVTGGGWINSPAGAYRPDPTLTGRANFGFVSKYKKGATVPEGQTEFQFQTGNLNFHSSSISGSSSRVARPSTKARAPSTGVGATASCSPPTMVRLTGSVSRSTVRAESSMTTSSARRTTSTARTRKRSAAEASSSTRVDRDGGRLTEGRREAPLSRS